MLIVGIYMDVKEKMDDLRKYLHGKKVVIAFSGGADSTLLASVAQEEAQDALAVMVDNGVIPAECVDRAEKIAQKIGIKLSVVHKNFLDDPAFKINPPNRCYVCKLNMYQELDEIARTHQYDFVVDGTNISDLLENRPGIKVNLEKEVKMPLVQSGFTSQDVRNILKEWNIDYNPSTTCLATRLSTGEEITLQKINRIEYAENLIKNTTGMEVVRVRDQEGLARIEVEDVDKIINKKLLHYIDSELRSIGFKRVTLDITGYKDSNEDIIIYKPCTHEKNRIMFETDLPYHINLPDTCQELESWGEVKCSQEMGVAMLEMEGKNITLFAKGKIVARKVKDREDAQELLVKILPCIRR
ncbi:MAG: pyridinium-3,5-biscarboxylic acid mononucleotide sulfurtransferase [Methanobacterium sp.]|nr:pyridinium-3,5-biscarboxylic acid mononucleotide sulfurtransferase [Methanobacterium sp.]